MAVEFDIVLLAAEEPARERRPAEQPWRGGSRARDPDRGDDGRRKRIDGQLGKLESGSQCLGLVVADLLVETCELLPAQRRRGANR